MHLLLAQPLPKYIGLTWLKCRAAAPEGRKRNPFYHAALSVVKRSAQEAFCGKAFHLAPKGGVQKHKGNGQKGQKGSHKHSSGNTAQ